MKKREKIHDFLIKKNNLEKLRLKIKVVLFEQN